MEELQVIQSALARGKKALMKTAPVYPRSIQKKGNGFVFMARFEEDKKLVMETRASCAKAFEGRVRGGLKIAPLSPANARALRKAFPFTAPAAIGRRVSFGTGDRVGLATPGHIRAFRKYKVFPVLAQQSMREMGRTGRTPQDVIDDASFGVFQEGYRGGFAADADHIKTAAEALMCLSIGFTMFTVDAADHIDKKAAMLSDREAEAVLSRMREAAALKNRYLNKTVRRREGARKIEISFTAAELGRAAAVYGRAVSHMVAVYKALKKAAKRRAFDFEVSIDETETDTLPRDHYFVASELSRRGVRFQSLAPKFVGQFQKGIDYIGDTREFARQFAEHAMIARLCGGYKVSVHSGSDKFKVFPVVGRETRGYFHGKTAGTSWLEAVRVVTVKEPNLYRRMHRLALMRFEEDRRSYHVTTNLSAIPDVSGLPDEALPGLLDKADSRQLMHITYGSILSSNLKEELFEVLHEHEETHYAFLAAHMERHMKKLGIRRNHGLSQ